MITKKQNIHQSYMNMALTWANGQSYAERRKVGALIVKDGMILSQGHNGTISGFDNRCEDNEGNTNTDHVLHAESNAILKVAQSTNSTKGATIYTTDAPCIDCAKLIIQSGIKEVYYSRHYRDIGIDILLTAGIDVYELNYETGDIVKYGLLTHHSFFKPTKEPRIIKMDMNVVELFRKLFKNKANDRTTSSIDFGNKTEISIRIKPIYNLNHKYYYISKFQEFQERNNSADGWILTCTGSVTYNDYNSKDVYSLITPEIIDEGRSLKFSTYYGEDTDRYNYGDLYPTGDIPFSAIESIKIISK